MTHPCAIPYAERFADDDDARLDDEAIIELSPPATCQMANEWFDFAVEDHFWFQWRLAAIRKVLGSRGVVAPALEIGCGNAAARNQLESAFDCRIDAADLNIAALQRATPGRGQLHCYNVHDRRPEWRERFATIMLLDTLEHIDEPVAFLESTGRHLRPDGRLLITVPAQQYLYSRYDSADGHVKRYNARRLRRELDAAGLTLERYVYWGLTLIPVLAVRKLVVAFCKPEQVIAVGFQPSSGVVDRVLRGLMHLERSCGTRMPTGAALTAVARRKEAP